MLRDSFGRPINYLRLAVTDHCNLRCTYCMPEAGLDWIKQSALMTDEEIFKICALFADMGVQKIRITGGEPFVRKGLVPLLHRMTDLPQVEELSITTNGLLTEQYIPQMKAMGVKTVNISLDTLDRERFIQITRRDGLTAVLDTIYALLAHGIKVKINCVVMERENIADIIPLVLLSQKHPVDIRFIEEMPFNGTSKTNTLKWDHAQILAHINQAFPDLMKVADPKHSTAYHYQVPGFSGNIGIIAAYTRSFCGSCNRLRLTPDGELRTCLYQTSGPNLKEALRSGKSNLELQKMIEDAVYRRHKDGWEAEKANLHRSGLHKSMATIGG